jgi:hypothetical protein
MIDVLTGKPLRVIPLEDGGGAFTVAVSQLEEIQRLFDSRGIFYWADDQALSWNGGPEEVDVHLGRNVDPAVVQAALDSVP